MYVRKETRRPKEYSLDRLLDKGESGMTYLDLVRMTSEKTREMYMHRSLNESSKENNCEEIVIMRLKGMKQVDIAKKLGVHQSTISEKLRNLYVLARKELGIKEQLKIKKSKNT